MPHACRHSGAGPARSSRLKKGGRGARDPCLLFAAASPHTFWHNPPTARPLPLPTPPPPTIELAQPPRPGSPAPPHRPTPVASLHTLPRSIRRSSRRCCRLPRNVSTCGPTPPPPTSSSASTCPSTSSCGCRCVHLLLGRRRAEAPAPRLEHRDASEVEADNAPFPTHCFFPPGTRQGARRVSSAPGRRARAPLNEAPDRCDPCRRRAQLRKAAPACRTPDGCRSHGGASGDPLLRAGRLHHAPLQPLLQVGSTGGVANPPRLAPHLRTPLPLPRTPRPTPAPPAFPPPTRSVVFNQLLLRFDSWANVRSKAPVDVGSSAQPPTPSDSRGSAAVDVPAATVVPRRNELSFLFLDCDTVTAWVRQTLQPSLEDVLGLRDAKPDLKVWPVRAGRNARGGGVMGWGQGGRVPSSQTLQGVLPRVGLRVISSDAPRPSVLTPPRRSPPLPHRRGPARTRCARPATSSPPPPPACAPTSSRN